MDERVSRRIEDVDHIRAKKYFRTDHPAPDPYDRSVSTRFWKHSVRIWAKAMKTQYYRGEQPDVHTSPCYLFWVPLSFNAGGLSDEASPRGADGCTPLQRVFKEPYIHVATSELSGEEALTGDVHIKMLDN